MSTREIVFDIMLLISCAVMTLGIVGIMRMPDVYTKIHGASKSLFLGVVMLCIASSVIATPGMNMRLGLIAFLVILTTPLASHVIGKSAFVMHERMETPGAVDESHMIIEDDRESNGGEPGWRI